MAIEIILTKNLGFCFGVKRALKLAKNKAKEKKDKVYTLGPLIHNTNVIDVLKTKNVEVLEGNTTSCSGLEKDKSFVIRSHGITKEFFNELKENNYDFVDATCPFVTKAHRIAKDLNNKNIQTIILGDKNHPEVIGIKSYSHKGVIIVKEIEELENFVLDKKVAVISQTTQDITKFDDLIKYLQNQGKEVFVHNTICSETNDRQTEALEIADKVDKVIIIGGKNSANTKKLFDMCKRINGYSYHIEDDTELDDNFVKGIKKVGILTGASTPSWIIRKIITKIRRLANNDGL